MLDDDFSDGAGADVDSAPDAGTPQPGPPPILGAPPMAPAAPPGHLFKSIISSLGVALAQGVQAGIQAPMSPQGPPIAAANAAEAPQRAFEQRMANQRAVKDTNMDDMNIAMTQLKLHQLQMITSKMDEDKQNAVYNTGRDTMTQLLEKGKVEELATGDLASVNQMFLQKQKEAQADGRGLLPMHILPAPGSTADKPKYSLVMLGKDKLTDDIDETWGPDDIGVSDEDFKAAGLTRFKFHAGTGMDQQKALGLKTTQYLQWVTKSEQALSAYKRNQANIVARSTEAQKNRNFKYGLEQIRQAGANARAASKIASDSGNKDLAKAQSNVDTAANNLARTQAKPTFMGELDGGQKRSVAALQRAFDDAVSIRDNLLKKVTGGPPKRQVGDPVTLKDGRKTKIKSVNPDGSYTVE